MERTFLAVKPDGVQRGLVAEILGRFERKGFKLVGLKLMQVTEAQAKQHYAEHDGKPFFPGLVEYITSGPIVAMAWEGPKVISSARTLIGATKPWDAAPGSIRGDFAVDIGRNLIHGSDSPESAERELGIFFSAEELHGWNRQNEKWIVE